MKKCILLLSLIYLAYNTVVEEELIPGVYNFIFNEQYFLYYKKNNIKYGKSLKCKEESNFRIKMNTTDNYYKIEHATSNSKLIGNPGKLKIKSDSDKNEFQWTFIKNIESNQYIIKNKNGCYISNKLSCEESIEKSLKFNIVMIYEEVEHSEEDLELIEKEPIDIIIKYIDLSDPNLVREGIPQIKKDQDNEELRYNVRSILKNIPWVRKIFIVMPNKKVKYFKDYDSIKEKIVYVYDKDLLGFDSANSVTFAFCFWMMEKFNISENYILMDDDCFIGKPLKKSDFFYVQNGKVVPSIVSTRYTEYTLEMAKKESKKYKKGIKNNQCSDDFWYTVFNGYLYLLKEYGSPLIIPVFTHNSIPCNIHDTKELYNIANNSEYRYQTLYSIIREVESFQFQSLYLAYTFIEHKRKSNLIPGKFIDVRNAIIENYNYSLICINTGAENISKLSFKKAKIAMEYYFPEPTPYEIKAHEDWNNWVNLSFSVTYEMEKQLRKVRKKEKSSNRYIFIFYIIFAIMILIEILTIYIYKKKIKLLNEYIIVPKEEEEMKEKNYSNI